MKSVSLGKNKVSLAIAALTILVSAVQSVKADTINPDTYRCIDLKLESHPGGYEGATLRTLVVKHVAVSGGKGYGDFILDGNVLDKGKYTFQVGPEVISPNMALWVIDSSNDTHPIYCIQN